VKLFIAFSEKFISKFIPSIQHMTNHCGISACNCPVKVVTMKRTSCQYSINQSIITRATLC